MSESRDGESRESVISTGRLGIISSESRDGESNESVNNRRSPVISASESKPIKTGTNFKVKKPDDIDLLIERLENNKPNVTTTNAKIKEALSERESLISNLRKLKKDLIDQAVRQKEEAILKTIKDDNEQIIKVIKSLSDDKKYTSR